MLVPSSTAAASAVCARGCRRLADVSTVLRVPAAAFVLAQQGFPTPTPTHAHACVFVLAVCALCGTEGGRRDLGSLTISWMISSRGILLAWCVASHGASAFSIGAPTAIHAPAYHTAPTCRPTAAPSMMAGFGASASTGSKTKKKKGAGGGAKAAKTELSPKRQWDKFKDLVSDGAERVAVYAKLPDDKWIEVGEVAVGAKGTAAQAAQFNKRLILEHAPRVHPPFGLRAKDLIAGIAGDDGQPEVLTRQEVPDGLKCGFEGAPDASGKYAKVRGTTRGSDPTAIIGSAARG